MAIINGTNGDDVLMGTGDSDLMTGFNGNDRLIGGNGDDFMSGAGDNDSLFGGAGDDDFATTTSDDRDIMTGGTGADLFRAADANVLGEVVYSTGVGPDRDVVADFDGAEGDKINVANIDADLTSGGDQNFTFAGGTETIGIGEIGFIERNNLTILQGNADADPGPEFEIQLNGTALGLAADDFVL